MSNTATVRPRPVLAGLGRFVPVVLLFVAAGVVEAPFRLPLLLLADTLAIGAIAWVAGFDAAGGYRAGLLRAAPTWLLLGVLHVALIAALATWPARWLGEGGALPAALTLSGALLLATLALWRVWPAFSLPYVQTPTTLPAGAWTTLKQALAVAARLGADAERFFALGLPSALVLVLLNGGALALSLPGVAWPAGLWRGLFIGYAVVLVPFGQLLLLTRCQQAVFGEARAAQRRGLAASEALAPSAAAAPGGLPPGLAPAELGAALLCAARAGQSDLAIAALDAGADPNGLPAPADRDQRSLLALAVTQPDLRLLRALIAAGVDVNRLHGGLSPLIAATRDSYQGRPDAVMTLLANGADPRATDADGCTALHHAARCSDPIVAALLIDAGAPLDPADASGASALGIACANANWRTARVLLEHGACVAPEAATPPLLLAAAVADDDPAGVRLLLRHKAAVDARGALDRTALMAAALAGNVRVVEVLLAGGATVDLADRHGTTALMEAARAGSVAVIHALGKRKADPDRVDGAGRSALLIACASRLASEDGVRALLALGADRTLAASDGRRALDHAVASGRWRLVALLDPSYPLPSSLGGDPAAGEAASATHLLDALRFGHWNVAADFRNVVPDWPASELAALYAALPEPGQRAARDWIANAGLDPDSRLADGRRLFDACIDALPASLPACIDLAARGASVGGAGLVARVLERAPPGASGDGVRAFALDLLGRGADWCGGLGAQSVLHLAAEQGAAALADAVLGRGADVNARDARGRTPLHVALKADGDPMAVVRVLVRYGAKPEIAAASGETPLGLALARGDRALIGWLNWTGWPLPGRALAPADLPAAATRGDADAVERLLALGLPVDAVDAQGASALLRASGGGNAALVGRLLAAGADPALASHSGVTCLSAAVSARREAVVQTLLEHGVAADQRLPGGGTPLMIAAGFGLLTLTERLLRHGADVHARDEVGTTALLAAAQHAFASGDTDGTGTLLDLLLRAGADPRQTNTAGQDALLLLLGATASPGTRCDPVHLQALATLLLDRGAAPDTQDQRGVSPLHACAMHGLLGPARLLKARGARIDLADTFGRSAADVASLLGYVDVAVELDGAPVPIPGPNLTLRRRVTD